MGVFSGIASAIGSWWGNIVNGVNTWITNLVVGIRNKITQTIMADVSIYFGWKTVDRLINAKGLKDAGLSILGLLASPFVGYLFGNIVNGLIPTPSTEPIQLIPTITPLTYTPPSLTVETPTEKPTPYMGVTPTPPIVGAGLPLDIALRIPKNPTCDYTTTTRDASLTMLSAPSYEFTLELTCGSLTMPTIAYEYEVS
jgi:hypothetical protein